MKSVFLITPLITAVFFTAVSAAASPLGPFPETASLAYPGVPHSCAADGPGFPRSIGPPADLPPAPPRRPEASRYLLPSPRFRAQLAEMLGVRKAAVQSPAALHDFDADGDAEAAVYAITFSHPAGGPPETRQWLLILDRGMPPYADPAAFAIAARCEVRIATSAPHLRIAPVFPGGSAAVIITEDRRATRLTDNHLFRFQPASGRLTPVELRGGSIGGRSGPGAVSGRIEFFRKETELMAEVIHGRGMALRSRYRWNGRHFILSSEEIPSPKSWEEALIRRAAAVTGHRLLALQLTGDGQSGRAVAFAEDGHYGYYSLFEYHRTGRGEEGTLRLSLIEEVRGDPQPLFRRHGISPRAGRGFYYLPAAGRFVPSPEPVLP